jgi:gamma-glutamylcysteine synthetase
MRFNPSENKAGASSRTPKVSQAARRTSATARKLAARARHAVPLQKQGAARRIESNEERCDERDE